MATVYKRRLRTVSLKLHRDYVCSEEVELATLSAPYDVYEVLKTIFSTLDDDQEHLILLVLNGAHELTGYKVVASGGQTHSMVDRKVLLRNALLLGASAIIIAHNHPSGSLQPSSSDRDVTRGIAEAGRIVEIPLLDHLIYTHSGYVSLREAMPELFV